MPKIKSHKGLLKRVRVTKNGKVKLHRAFGRHLRSHKSGSAIRNYRQATYASAADAPRLRTLLGLSVPKKSKSRGPASSDASAGE